MTADELKVTLTRRALHRDLSDDTGRICRGPSAFAGIRLEKKTALGLGASFVLLPEERLRSLRVMVTSYRRTELARADHFFYAWSMPTANAEGPGRIRGYR